MFSLTRFLPKAGAALIAGLFALPITALTGCDTDEEILDVETPDGQLKIERDRDTGEIEVEVEDVE